MPFTVLRHEKMTLPALVHIIEEPEDDYSCRGIKQDREKGGKRMKQLAETSRRRKPASGRQNMFGKRSAARLKVIINLWKNPSRSCQQSRFTFFPSRCGAATFLLRPFARFSSAPDVQEVAGGPAGTQDICVGPWTAPGCLEEEKSSFVWVCKHHSSLPVVF